MLVLFGSPEVVNYTVDQTNHINCKRENTAMIKIFNVDRKEKLGSIHQLSDLNSIVREEFNHGSTEQPFQSHFTKCIGQQIKREKVVCGGLHFRDCLQGETG